MNANHDETMNPERYFLIIYHCHQEMKKEFHLVKMLLDVRNAIKKQKGEDFDEEKLQIESVEAVLDECEQLLEVYKANKESANCASIFLYEAGKAALIIHDLKKKTNFFGNQMIDTDVLNELKEATKKFMEIAE